MTNVSRSARHRDAPMPLAAATPPELRMRAPRSRLRRRIAIAATIAFSVAAASPGRAEDHATATPGQALYRRYCSACHGEDGRGTGIVSGLMKPKPADLTQLAKKAGGVFPFEAVMRTIDGRQTLRAHGDSQMPVWGEIFAREAEESDDSVEGARLAARGKVVEITEYLATIQER